ncbi:MAG TPA: DUF4265 domain-containing protein [Dongiaceae bacterium]|nr:DUF4265 domain-containing protein [Dongiaceae bacterium]
MTQGDQPLQLVKVAFVLDGGPLTIEGTVHGGRDEGVETMWAEAMGEDRYRLRNSPFAAYGISFHDVVAAKVLNGQLTATRIVLRSGHSTYRIRLSDGISKEDFLARWPSLAALRCSYENADSRLFAIDALPEADIHAVYAELQRGETDGTWEFEEAHCAHVV